MQWKHTVYASSEKHSITVIQHGLHRHWGRITVIIIVLMYQLHNNQFTWVQKTFKCSSITLSVEQLQIQAHLLRCVSSVGD